MPTEHTSSDTNATAMAMQRNSLPPVLRLPSELILEINDHLNTWHDDSLNGHLNSYHFSLAHPRLRSILGPTIKRTELIAFYHNFSNSPLMVPCECCERLHPWYNFNTTVAQRRGFWGGTCITCSSPCTHYVYHTWRNRGVCFHEGVRWMGGYISLCRECEAPVLVQFPRLRLAPRHDGCEKSQKCTVCGAFRQKAFCPCEVPPGETIPEYGEFRVLELLRRLDACVLTTEGYGWDLEELAVLLVAADDMVELKRRKRWTTDSDSGTLEGRRKLGARWNAVEEFVLWAEERKRRRDASLVGMSFIWNYGRNPMEGMEPLSVEMKPMRRVDRREPRSYPHKPESGPGWFRASTTARGRFYTGQSSVERGYSN
ncbi:hypothetical protein BZA05DRAFT_383874 [Tricharina praecox]|uniref:uncharacterized protein n=1 Tax=Tricharina praecox TaxID=43433 RepID=UPI00221F0E64|nr:uncharacterized protein BZA05DRAFT_383874 [Tricharina praecox]KAI5857531.1 hypothetical protein BZA05DRAFT_383874 [Tricharina praecox]